MGAALRFYLASGNAHKALELQALARAGGAPAEILSARELGGMPTVAEDAGSFLGNARKKAHALRALAPAAAWVLADDSGLCVEALGGAPGVEFGILRRAAGGRGGQSGEAGGGAASGAGGGARRPLCLRPGRPGPRGGRMDVRRPVRGHAPAGAARPGRFWLRSPVRAGRRGPLPGGARRGAQEPAEPPRPRLGPAGRAAPGHAKPWTILRAWV